MRSSFVAIVIGARESRERIAAPKSLLPEEIFVRVNGTMDCSVRARRADITVLGECVSAISIFVLSLWFSER